jgi:methyltransferase family protein
VADEFDEVWPVADAVPGWLTRAQGRTLWDAAGSVAAGGVIAEIGSHQGRSTVVLGHRAAGRGARVIAIDPFVDGAMFGGAATRSRFEKHVHDAGLDTTVELRAQRSTELRPTWTQPLALVYVDGKHDYWTAGDDLRWIDHLPDGAPLLVHDAFSSIGVTLAVLRHVLGSSRLRYVGRTGSLAEFRIGRPTPRDRARVVAELPWFARNVVIKVGLRLLRLTGHRRPDPF